MKYIMFKRKMGDVEQLIPIIFPNELVHSDVARAIRSHPEMKNFEPVSAGQTTVTARVCHGESETLKLKADPVRDTWAIATIDYEHGLTGNENPAD